LSTDKFNKNQDSALFRHADPHWATTLVVCKFWQYCSDTNEHHVTYFQFHLQVSFYCTRHFWFLLMQYFWIISFSILWAWWVDTKVWNAITIQNNENTETEIAW